MVDRQSLMRNQISGVTGKLQGSLGPMFDAAQGLGFGGDSANSAIGQGFDNDFGLDMTLGQNAMGQNINPMFGGSLNTNLNPSQGGYFIPGTSIYKKS
jgi:hypothetical protein